MKSFWSRPLITLSVTLKLGLILPQYDNAERYRSHGSLMINRNLGLACDSASILYASLGSKAYSGVISPKAK